MVQELETQLVFENNSSNGESQILVERQLFAPLIHMESYGNVAFLTKIGDLCRMGKGTIDKICRRVIIAIQFSNFRTTHVRWLAKSKREEAKRWLEEQAGVEEWRK